MGLEGRLRYLERRDKGAVIRVICPECRKLFTAPAYAVLEVIVHAWIDEEIEPHPLVRRMIEHEHDWEEFVEISGGRTLLDAGAPPTANLSPD